MRMIVAGAEITDAVIDVVDTLQNERVIGESYLRVLDEVTRTVILDLDTADAEKDSVIMARLRVLQMLRRDLTTLMSPPDRDLEENDTPIIEL